MVVTFDYTSWKTRYPTLAEYTPEDVALEYFSEATLYCDNTDASIVPYNPPTVTTRATLLNMLVAHIAALNDPARAGIVGRISSAGQGGVNVSTELQTPGSAAWYAQTQYGLNFWQATARFRRFTYAAGPQPFYQPRPMYRRH